MQEKNYFLKIKKNNFMGKIREKKFFFNEISFVKKKSLEKCFLTTYFFKLNLIFSHRSIRKSNKKNIISWKFLRFLKSKKNIFNRKLNFQCKIKEKKIIFSAK